MWAPPGERQRFPANAGAAKFPALRQRLDRQKGELRVVIRKARKEGRYPLSCPVERVELSFDLIDPRRLATGPRRGRDTEAGLGDFFEPPEGGETVVTAERPRRPAARRAGRGRSSGSRGARHARPRERLVRRGAARAVTLAACLAGTGASSVAADRASVSPVAACAGAEVVAAGQPADDVASIASYAIYSDRDRVGEIASIRRRLDEGRRLEISSHTRIEIDELFLDFSFESSESICIVDGRVERYAAEVEVDGESSTLQATRSGPERLVVSGHGSRPQDTFEESLVEDGHATLFETAVDAVIGKRVADVSKVVLDLVDLEIGEMRFRYAGEAEVAVGEVTFDTHVVTFEGATRRGTQWLVADRGGFIPVLERGEDEGGVEDGAIYSI